MNKRYIGALVISPFIIFIFLGGYYLQFMCMLMSLIGIYEFYKVLEAKEYRPLKYAGYLTVFLYYILITKNININNFVYIYILVTLLILCIPVLNIKYNFVDVSLTIFGVVYIAVFFSFIPLVNIKIHGNILVWLVFITAWACDTIAYYTGRLFGNKKLCPKVSPNKTVEGSIGGVIGCALIAFSFGFIVQRYVYIMPLVNYLVIGIICGIMCQFGDLVASSIKRHVGVKDYSNLIPGHGGILDRFDSILYSAVVVFYYLTFVVGI